MAALRSIPLVDVRRGGPVGHADMHRDSLEELRAACLSVVPPVGRGFIPFADSLCRRWIERSASPYAAEIAALAAIARAPGVYLVNTAYEWACTAACHGADVPGLVRTLDWPFPGMGRGLSVAWQEGPAGDFFNVTWPGAVGVLTALAPGRFAATINQAPLRRRTVGGLFRWLDYAINAVAAFARAGCMPPAHALRQVFENAADYQQARQMLLTVPMARPVLVALIGVRSGETCLIERTETGARVHDGSFVVANDWQVPQRGWEPRSCGGPPATDSRDRRAALAKAAGALAVPFDWLAPPVHNWATRVAVEMSAADPVLRAMGFEPVGGYRSSAQATEMFDLRRAIEGRR